MVVEHFIIKMVAFIKENGKTIKCMDTENFTIIIPNQHIKVIGIWISFMDMVKFIMIIQLNQINHLIIRTLISYNNIGNIMKVDYKLILGNLVKDTKEGSGSIKLSNG